MNNFSKRKKGFMGTIITVSVLVVIVAISNIKINNLSYAEGIFNFFVMPVQNGLTYLKNKISGNNTFFVDVGNLKQENKQLKDENAKLQETLREFEIVKSENETLKEYVDLKDKYSNYKTIPGYVINKDVSNYGSTIVINVGKSDGVDVNMPVISENGLVGHVISATGSTAKVQTIVDPSSSISCILTSSKDTIIAKGSLDGTSILKATYIPTEATIMNDDTVETSGLGGLYPKGILVGTVKQVENTKNITDRYAVIETAVNFSKLQTILVITQ